MLKILNVRTTRADAPTFYSCKTYFMARLIMEPRTTTKSK